MNITNQQKLHIFTAIKNSLGENHFKLVKAFEKIGSTGKPLTKGDGSLFKRHVDTLHDCFVIDFIGAIHTELHDNQNGIEVNSVHAVFPIYVCRASLRIVVHFKDEKGDYKKYDIAIGSVLEFNIEFGETYAKNVKDKQDLLDGIPLMSIESIQATKEFIAAKEAEIKELKQELPHWAV